MKTILLILSVLLLSCGGEKEYHCEKATIRILDKKEEVLGGNTYLFYIYDSRNAFWCETNFITYNSYKVGDTLPTIVVHVKIRE